MLFCNLLMSKGISYNKKTYLISAIAWDPTS
uniref:Uncharacterized protein n=1 Tax=Rhizophora mucronata TaxID=61149 RepID=A0A2P2PGL3_RHIMU